MKHFLRIMLLTATLLLLPAGAFAMQESVWSFRGKQLPGEWRIGGIAAPVTTENGLHVTATGQGGSMISTLALPHPTEVLRLVYISGVAAPVKLLWHRRGDPEQILVELPFTLPPSVGSQILDINLDAYPQWDRRADTIGFTFGAGTDIVLQEMRFGHWNMLEKAREAAKSYWIFDSMSPMSINFLWGPVITFNPIATHDLFSTSPPQGRSGNWLFFVALALIAAGIAASTLMARRGWRWIPPWGPVPLFLLCFAVLWILYDVRMGLELLSYARTDYATWVFAAPGERELRNYLDFNDIMEQSLPTIRGEERFALVRSPLAPVTAMVRYFALPAIAEEPSGPRDDLRVWLVMRGENVDLDTGGRLTVDGIPWSRPGTVLQRFEKGSLLFRTNE